MCVIMREKDTNVLQEELRKSDNLDKFEEENLSELYANSVAEYLNELLIKYDGKKQVSKEKIWIDESKIFPSEEDLLWGIDKEMEEVA